MSELAALRVVSSLLGAMLFCAFGPALPPPQAASTKNAVLIRSVAVQQDLKGTAIEIVSNGVLVPTITKLDGPPRLVIDLPGAINAVRRHSNATTGDVKAVRIDQFQQNPPVTRVVIDLLQPRGYSWEMVEDRLRVYLRELQEFAAASPAAVAAAFTQGMPPATSSASEGNASIMLAGTRIAPGSSVTAGEETAVLNLSRGGQVRVCPGTTVSVTPSASGRDLMVGMSTGAIETHYTVSSAADSILTPDFRILPSGPGEFDYAVSADSKGNTCVRALSGNTASAVVSELIGDGTYQVKSSEEVVFRSGQLAKTDSNLPADCGCPTTRTNVLRTESTPPAPVAQQVVSLAPAAAPAIPDSQPGIPNPTAAAPPVVPPPTARAAASPETAPLPPLKPNEKPVFVEAPLVYRANNAAPAPIKETQKLPPLSRRTPPSSSAVLAPSPVAAPSANPAEKATAKPPSQSRGFFGSIKHFFAKIFG